MSDLAYVVIAKFLKLNDFYYHLVGCFSSLEAARHAGERFANDCDRMIASENLIYDVDRPFLTSINVHGVEINKIHERITCMYTWCGALRKWSKSQSYDRIVKNLLHTEDDNDGSSNS